MRPKRYDDVRHKEEAMDVPPEKPAHRVTGQVPVSGKIMIEPVHDDRQRKDTRTGKPLLPTLIYIEKGGLDTAPSSA